MDDHSRGWRAGVSGSILEGEQLEDLRVDLWGERASSMDMEVFLEIFFLRCFWQGKKVQLVSSLCSSIFLWATTGCSVLQLLTKPLLTSEQVFSSRLNSYLCRHYSSCGMGSRRQAMPTPRQTMDSIVQWSFIWKSKMSSPAGFISSEMSSSFMACRLILPEMALLRLDLLSRLYLSIQQCMTRPISVMQAPMGMTVAQRQVNQMVQSTSAQSLPKETGISYMIWLASRWVRSVLPLQILRLITRRMCQGLSSHSMGTNSAFTKNIIDSSSITPKSSLKILWRVTSSTSSVMRAVVKNRQRVYLSAKEYSSLSLVGCFSKCTISCRRKAMMNLLKKMMAKIEPQTITQIFMLRVFIMASLAPECFSYRACSMVTDFSWRRKQKATVRIAMKRIVKTHPRNCRRQRLPRLMLMCSQMISLGSGASIILIFCAFSSPNISTSLVLSNLLWKANSVSNSSLTGSDSSTMMTFSHSNSSFCASTISLSISSSASSSFLSISKSTPRMVSSSALAVINFFFFFSSFSFSSSRVQNSLIWPIMINSSILYSLLKKVRKRVRTLVCMPGTEGRSLRMMEKSLRLVLRSSQQALALVSLSRMQIRANSCSRKDPTRRIDYGHPITYYSRAMLTKTPVQVRMTPSRVCLEAVPLQKGMLSWQLQQTASALQLSTCSRRRMITYFMNLKQRGKPNPRASSSLELAHTLMGRRSMGRKQQGQRWTVCGLASSLPGRVALAWASARSQSGSRRSRSIILTGIIVGRATA